jgi:hypothetical protein
MKFQNGDFGHELNMTSLQGHIQTTYAILVATFGEPQGGYDDYKCDCEWNIKFADGVVVSIYNWKNGKNYCGEEGLALEDITEWNIGGHPNTGAASRVRDEVSHYLNQVCYRELRMIDVA